MPDDTELVEAYTPPERPSILEDVECPRCGATRRRAQGKVYQCWCDEPSEKWLEYKNSDKSTTHSRWKAEARTRNVRSA